MKKYLTLFLLLGALAASALNHYNTKAGAVLSGPPPICDPTNCPK